MSAKYSKQFVADLGYYCACKLRYNPYNNSRISEFRKAIKHSLDTISLRHNRGRKIGHFIERDSQGIPISYDLYRIDYDAYAMYFSFEDARVVAFCMLKSDSDLPKHLTNLGVVLERCQRRLNVRWQRRLINRLVMS